MNDVRQRPKNAPFKNILKPCRAVIALVFLQGSGQKIYVLHTFGERCVFLWSKCFDHIFA